MTTKTNLDLCFSELTEAEREKLAKDSIIETFKTIVEMGPMWFWPQDKIFEYIVEIEGLETIQAAYAKKKGVILLAPHLGNWELAGSYLKNCGCGQANAMYQEPKDPALGELIYSARKRGGLKLMATNTKGVGQVLSVLRKGELVGILPDQVPPQAGGAYANFFGVTALTMTLLPRLLNKTGAKAILVYARRVNGAKGVGFKICFKEVADKIYAEHMPDSLQALNDAIEAAVREFPEQYQWEYKRFKGLPEGSPPVY